MSPARSLPQATESLCPVCLRRIPAEYVLDPAEEGYFPRFFLNKECPEHGAFSVPIWRGLPDFRSWVRDKNAFVSSASICRAGSWLSISTAGCARIMPSIPVRG